MFCFIKTTFIISFIEPINYRHHNLKNVIPMNHKPKSFAFNIILFFFFFLFFSDLIKGQNLHALAENKDLVSSVKNHIIIAIDQAGCNSWIGEEEVMTAVKRMLFNNNEKTDQPVFRDNDYISVVGFNMDARQNNMNCFIKPEVFYKDTIAYKQFESEQLKHLLSNNWSTFAIKDYPKGSIPYSLLSVVKPYILRSLKTTDKEVGRTFLIFVTDHHYNGNDFYNEIKFFVENHQSVNKHHLLNSDSIFEKCYDVERNYYIRFRKSFDVCYKSDGKTPNGFVELFEYVPIQEHFALGSVVDYPSHLVAVRKKDGSYNVDVPLKWRNNEQYRFKKMQIVVEDSDTINEGNNINLLADIQQLSDTTLSFCLPSQKNIKNLTLKTWLLLYDGFYNATLMSPDKDGTKESGKEGLNVRIPIEYENDATIFGCKMPLWLWKISLFERQEDAALFWEFIIPIAVLLALIRYYTHKTIYSPKANEIELK